MKKIQLLAGGADMAPLVQGLESPPELWNADTMRTESPDSPHHQVSDIFVRYAADPKAQGPHESIWYPCADLIPVKDHVFNVMSFVEGERLGGVLITKIPAGCDVKPHIDRGWHADHYRKFCVQVHSAPGQKFVVDDEELEARPGDLYEFRNSFMHYVINPSDEDRISLIICIQTSKDFQ